VLCCPVLCCAVAMSVPFLQCTRVRQCKRMRC
jgi:hypothetical protein